MVSPQAGPIISGEPGAWDEHLEYGLRRKYPANVTLLNAGEKPAYIYYIHSGEVLVSNYASPESMSRLFILREKSLLGLIGLFTPGDSSATWVTLKPCVLYAFDKKTIYEKVPRNLLLNMLEQMGAMSSAMTRRFSHGHLKRLEVRLARLVIQLMDSCPPAAPQPANGIAIEPSITQEMASDLLGMHPVTLNRLLALLRASGVLGRFTKKRLEIFDSPTLHKYANGEMPPLNA